jgi:hypothetical protein
VRIDVLDKDVDAITDARALKRRALVVSRTHHHGALTEDRIGVLDRAVGSISADDAGEPEGLLEEAQGNAKVLAPAKLAAG